MVMSGRETRLPLNSKRLTGRATKRIATELGLPTTASTAEVLQMIDAKLSDGGREPSNVQVLMDGDTAGSPMALMDETGIFLEIPEEEETPAMDQEAAEDPENVTESEGELEKELTAVQQEVEALQEELTAAKERVHSLEGEVSNYQAKLGDEKIRYKQLWKINCDSAMQYDVFLCEKDDEICELKQRLAEITSTREAGYPAHRPRARASRSDSIESHTSSPRTKTVLPRKGKAPPVETFQGDSRGVKFEDWLPSFERAADWNGWSDQDRLLQLAGHLRGRALQEWGLLQAIEKQTMDAAVENLQSRLDPGSRMLGALEFKHMSQMPREGVGEFITRLEKAFREAYGREPLSKETRDALLYAQLQDSLRYELVQAPAVSAALAYEQLCIAAKGEERRLMALKKRQELESGRSPPAYKPTFQSNRYTRESSGTDNSGRKVCYVCRQPGHFSRDCRQRKTESSGGHKWKNPETRQVQTQPEVSVAENPIDYLVSSDDDDQSSVQTVRVRDTGSKVMYANVDLHGVPVKGVIDSGADITILGGDLFKTVATVAKLKKKNFRKADKTPRTYDQRPFVLHGCMDLDISFEDKTMSTPVYIKMDSSTPLLLSEGVCRQLGIIRYHPSIVPPTESADVPMVKVSLVRSAKLLPQQTTPVTVQFPTNKPDALILIEADLALIAQGVHLEQGLVQPGLEDTTVLLTNRTGFTVELFADHKLGTANEVDLISPVQINDQGQLDPGPRAHVVQSMPSDQVLERKQKLMTYVDTGLQLPPNDKAPFCKFLEDYHTAFCLEEGERGETEMVKMQIDTGDAQPRRQAPRRMPFVVRNEVERQVNKMTKAGVIKKSHSPWASPVILVRKRNGDYRFCVDYKEAQRSDSERHISPSSN